MKKFCLLMLACALFASLVQAQVITIGTGMVVNSSLSYPAPYGNYYGGARHQIIVTAAELTAAGATAGNFTSLAFDVVTVNGAPLQGFGISMGHTTAVPSMGVNANWQTGLTSVFGPVTYTASTGWNTHNFSTPFAWNGTQNVVIETCFNNLSYTTNCVFRQTSTGLKNVKINRADNTPTVCTGTNNHYNGLNRPNMKIGLASPIIPAFQVNQAAASMNFDGALATAGAAAVTTKCAGALVNACADSAGNLAEIFLNVSPLVPTFAGGVGLNHANVINLDLAGGFFPLFGTFMPLGAATGTCPIIFPAPPGTFSAQMLAANPTSAIGISLSQACQLIGGAATGTLTLPTADDAIYLVNTNTAPLCQTTGLNYYGTSYTNFVVSTNGIVFSGTVGNNGWAPSAANALTYPGLFGVWSDFQSNANPAASIVVSNNTTYGGFDVKFTNVPYWGPSGSNTFTVALGTTGPRLEGLLGLGTAPNVLTGLFVSKGVGFATDPGPTAFAVGTGTTAVATDMLYKLGIGSPNLAGGANNLFFTFNATGGVDWLGL
jgi:hypothetical protein